MKELKKTSTLTKTYQKQYKRQTSIVVAFVCFVLLLLSFMLFLKLPIWSLQLGTLMVIMMLVSSLLMLAISIRTQIGWWNELAEFIKNHKSLKVDMNMNVCKSLDKYTFDLLRCINDKQEQDRKKLYDEWMGKIDQLAAPMGNDEKIRDVLKPMRDLIELAYGDKKGLKN